MNQTADPNRQSLWLARWPWVVAVLLVSLGYYGSYFQHGINFRDEGGTLTLLGQRLLLGEVPFRDVELGYNVGWFLPIAGLFGLTGVSFVGLRIFFLALSALTAVLAFLTVERAARQAGRGRWSPPIAFGAALLVILVPGMIFKNYNPLAAVANTWCLLGFILARGTKKSWWRALVGGLVLGATWLARIDLGTFFSVLWLGTLLLRVFGLPGTARERLLASGVGLLLVAAGVAAMHAPIVWDAHRRGYAEAFLGAYPNHWKTLMGKVGLSAKNPLAVKESPAAAVAGAKPPAAPPAKQGTWKNETLPRTGWSDVQNASAKRRGEVLGLWLLTYLPVLLMAPLMAWSTARWCRAIRAGENASTPLAALVLLGGALTMFPQFFFWRPDAPHLSEFGPGYWVSVIGATVLLGAGTSWRSPARWLMVGLLLHAAVWLWRMLPDRWCGTIAARENREVFFEGENGVRVYEQKKTVAWMNEVLRVIRERSRPDDYLVAYPYHPSFNVMANRRTYEKNVYIDNATAKSGWGKAAIARIERYQPAIVIVSDWDINGTDASRFRNWASDTYAHIRAHYDLVGTFDEKEKFEVYVRKPVSPASPFSTPPLPPAALPPPAPPVPL